MIVVKHAQQPLHTWRPGVTTRMWSGAASGAISVHMGEQFFEPETGAPLHWHYYEEHVTFLSGRVELYYDGESAVFDEPVTAIFLPQKIHGFRNVGDEVLHLCGATNWPVNESYFVDESGSVVDTMRWWQSDRENDPVVQR